MHWIKWVVVYYEQSEFGICEKIAHVYSAVYQIFKEIQVSHNRYKSAVAQYYVTPALNIAGNIYQLDTRYVSENHHLRIC